MTNVRILIVLQVLGFCMTLQAQHLEDKHWIFTNWIHFDFTPHGLETEIIPHPSLQIVTNSFQTSISNESGELLFHASSCYVMDRDSYVMENGDSLSPGLLDIGYCEHGDDIWYQGSIPIPVPDHQHQYYLFTLDGGVHYPPNDTLGYISPLNLYYHLIDMNANEGIGKVILKRQVAIADTLAGGYLQACRHANGRDWWIVVPEWNSNCYYSILITPDGPGQPAKYCSGPVHGEPDWGAAVAFSQNGNFYAKSFSWVDDTINMTALYSFDRCTGSLTHTKTLHFPVEFPNYAGVSFSPSSQYLYITSYKDLWQYDMWAPDIQFSRVLAGRIQQELTAQKASLYIPKNALDGRIYIASPLGHRYLSTIHYPNRKGMDCGFKEHDLLLPMNRPNYHGLPTHPNYRLGPIDDSSCDTLEINNLPQAYFRYEIDSLNPLKLRLTNLSYFEPTEFEWLIDNQTISMETDAAHVFTEEGVYPVCLVASNSYGSDTFCLDISVQVTSTYDPIDLTVDFFPNPAKGIIYFENITADPLSFVFYNMLGQEKMRLTMQPPSNSIDISQLDPGGYFVIIENMKLGQRNSRFVSCN